MAGCPFARSFGRYLVAAVATLKESRYAADRRHTDTGQPMYFPVRKLALQVFDYAPAVRHGLDFGWRAQVAQECAAFLGRLQRSQRCVQIALSERFLAGSDVTVAFHGVPM
jgi:hypothetical protein